MTPEDVRQTAIAWNVLINALAQAATAWTKLQEYSVQELGNMTPEVQEHMSRFEPAMEFDVFLPLFCSYWLTNGGLQALKVPVPVKEKEKNNASTE